jgi:N-acetylglucosamine-6-phosphate deacetylase
MAEDEGRRAGHPGDGWNVRDRNAGWELELKDGVCLSDGALAGSVLTMDRAVENLQLFTGAPLGTAVRLASRNPARMVGLERLVALSPAAPANFNRYKQGGERLGSILHRRQIE